MLIEQECKATKRQHCLHIGVAGAGQGESDSHAELGVLDVVPAVSALNDGVNPDVELLEVGEGLLDLLGGGSVAPQVGGLAEEVGTETLVRVVKHSVLVGVAESGSILDGELDVPDELASLGTLGGGDLLRLAVEDLDGVTDIAGLDTAHTEASSESVTGQLAAEKFLERGGLEVGPLAVDVADGDSNGRNILGELSLVGSDVVLNLGDVASETGAADEGHDVRVVGKGEDLLVGRGLIPGGGADSHGLASLQVRELQSEGEGVPGGAGGVAKLELVGVSVHLVDTNNLGNNVEVALLGLSVLKRDHHVLGEDIVGGEVAAGPLAKGSEEGAVLLLDGRLVAGVRDWGEVTSGRADNGGLLGGEEGPGAVPVHGDVELTVVAPHAEGGSVETDNVTETEHDGEVLEALGVHDDGGVIATLGAGVEGGVGNLEGAHIQLAVDLVGEASVDDDTVDVLGLDGAERSLAELDVVVLLSLGLLGSGLGGSLGLLGGSGSWHGILFS